MSKSRLVKPGMWFTPGIKKLRLNIRPDILRHIFVVGKLFGFGDIMILRQKIIYYMFRKISKKSLI